MLRKIKIISKKRSKTFNKTRRMLEFPRLAPHGTMTLNDSVLLSSSHVAENHQKLVSILQTVVLCGRQNIAFCGHREDNKFMSKSHVNSGHFHTLLRFRIDSGDSLLANTSLKHPRRQHILQRLQNELIMQCGDHILSIIIIHDTKLGLFSILADEVTDTSNKEHNGFGDSILRRLQHRGEVCRL